MSSFRPSKISEDVFEKIKDELNHDYSDEYIRDVYEIGATTLNIIKRCRNFGEYKKYYARKLARRQQKQEEMQTESCSFIGTTQIVLPFGKEKIEKLRNAAKHDYATLLKLYDRVCDRIDLQARLIRGQEDALDRMRAIVGTLVIAVGMMMTYLIWISLH